MAYQPGQSNSQRTELKTGLRVDPQLVLRSQILQLSQADLEQVIEAELADNPALERLEEDHEPITDEGVLKSIAPYELKPQSEDYEFARSIQRDDEDALDWTDFASSTESLIDHLKAQIIPLVAQDHVYLAEFIIGCLDEKGYLALSDEEIAASTNTTLEEVTSVLRHLHECDPAGVGARSVQECLLLQLADGQSIEQRLAREIVTHYLDDLISRRHQRIMRRYKVVPELVQAAFKEVLKLNPYPAQGFMSQKSSRTLKPAAVKPDLKISRSELGWFVEVSGVDPSSLAVCRAYKERLHRLNGKSGHHKDEKAHLSEYVQRADNFIGSIKDRRRTLRSIGEYLAEKQMMFITTGKYQYLQPLTRSQLAKDLGLHESTVSRATMGKFVQIDNGQVISFEVFFKPALRVQKMIEEILETENPSTPLSDEAIAKILADRGVIVARRTVNKYRDRTRLLSSRGRRSA